MVSRLNRNAPLPNALPVRVDEPKVQRAFDSITTALQATINFLNPWVQYEKWQDVTFLNSWTNYGIGYTNAAFTKDPLGRVSIRGLVKRTVAGFGSTVPVFVLPAGYRPSTAVLIFAVVGNDKFTRIDIDSGGAVWVQASDSATPESFVSLDGISFDTRA